MTRAESNDGITLLEGGRAYFDALVEAIHEAKSEIHLQTYIYELDETGSRVLDALSAAVLRGVRVCLLVDALGSRIFTRAEAMRVETLGIQVAVYRRIDWVHLNRFHGRMHRKIVVADRRVLLIGGHNMADEYADVAVEGAYFDLSVRITGSVAVEAAVVAESLFERTRSADGLPLWRRLVHRRAQVRARSGQIGSRERIRLVVRDNGRSQRSIERAYRSAIASSKASLTMAHAYFLPSRQFINELRRAAKRGVAVTLILQGQSDHAVLRWAERGLYDRLLGAGVRIFEYQSRMLHAKVATSDGSWSTVGSSNLEPWSLRSNLEANVVISDGKFASELEGVLMRHVSEHCQAFVRSDLDWFTRVIAAIAYRLVRASFALTGGRWGYGSG